MDVLTRFLRTAGGLSFPPSSILVDSLREISDTVTPFSVYTRPVFLYRSPTRMDVY